jgi:hypothetical protein
MIEEMPHIGDQTWQTNVWLLTLLAWRAIRIFGWGWQLIAHPKVISLPPLKH